MHIRGLGRVTFRAAVIAAAWGGAVAVKPAAAQDAPGGQATGTDVRQNVDRFQRQLDQLQGDFRLRVNEAVPVDSRVYFDYGLYLSANYLSLDDANGDNRGLRQYELAAYSQLNLDGAHDFFFRGRALYRDFNPGDEFEPSGTGLDGRVDRLYYKFDLSRYLAGRTGQVGKGTASIKLGRDLVSWGTGLTLAADLDAVVIDLGYDPFTVELLAGITPLDTVDIDTSRRDFDDETRRAFYGALVQTRVSTHRPYAFVLVQRDHNPTGSTYQVGPTVFNTDYDYNSWYVGVGSVGALTDRLVYGAELVYEGGRTLSSPFTVNADGTVNATSQTRDDISAWAANVRLDYLCPDERNTRFSVEAIYATGDDDRLSSTNTFAGNAPGTRDHGFNAFGLSDVGTAFGPSVSNLISVRAGASTFPIRGNELFDKLQVGVDCYAFFKADRQGGFDEPTNDSRYLGFEPDVYLNWQITSDVALAMRYGIFFPGDAVQNDEEVRQFFFAGLTIAF
jgi:hypothetical protein